MTFSDFSYGSRTDLQAELVDAFSAQNEIYGIGLFGREAEGKQDQYSDIDMILFSNDLVKTKARCLGILAAISPILATLPLESAEDSYGEMVILQDYSPYQKIDLSMMNLNRSLPGIQLKMIYESKARLKESKTLLDPLQIKQHAAYKLDDMLFSAAKFTKCLFRNDPGMNQCWMGIANLKYVLLYEKHFGWEFESSKVKLENSDFDRLNENLSPEEKKYPHEINPPQAPVDLALSFQESMDLVINLSREKCAYFNLPVNHNLINVIQEFLDTELQLFFATVPA